MPPTAFNIEVIDCQNQVPPVNNSSSSTRKLRSRTLPDDKIALPTPEQILQAASLKNLRGWIVILKEYFGFIETTDYSALYKFGPVNIKKSKLQQSDLRVGTAVEFSAVPSINSNKPRRIVDNLLRLVPAAESLVAKVRYINYVTDLL